MSDLHEVYFTAEAVTELGELPVDRKALVEEKVRLVRAYGWQESLRLGLVRRLTGHGDAHEIKVKGRGPAFRLICYPLAGKDGRIVVTTSCDSKGDLLGRRLKLAVKRSETRLQNWISLHGEVLR